MPTNVQVTIGIGKYQTIYQTKALLPKNGIYLTLDMVLEPNTKYLVKHVLNLNKKTITLPPNCIIEVDGGQLYNGTLIGDNSILLNPNGVDSIVRDLFLGGTWLYGENAVAGPQGPPGLSFTYDDLTQSLKQDLINKTYELVINNIHLAYPNLDTSPTELPYRFGDYKMYLLLLPAIDNTRLLGNFYDTEEDYFDLDNLPENAVILEAFVFNRQKEESAQCIKDNNKWSIIASNSDFSPDYALIRYYLETQ